jgi:SnoaL-like domain
VEADTLPYALASVNRFASDQVAAPRRASDLAPDPPANGVTTYLKAADEDDLDALAACFTDDGTVLDEGRTYRGREQIRARRESLSSQWEFTRTITGSESQAGGYLVRTHVEGSFPGGVADLSFRFTLAGDLIRDLTIL